MNFLVLPVSNRDHIQGAKTALTTFVEYGDYQSSGCVQAHQTYVNTLNNLIKDTELRQLYLIIP